MLFDVRWTAFFSNLFKSCIFAETILIDRMISEEEIFAVGKIVKTHGLKGEMAFTATTSVFEEQSIPFIFLKPEGLIVPFYVENVRIKAENSGFIKLERVDNEEQAQELIGLAIYLPITYQDKIADDEIDVEYLIGFDLTEKEKGYIGKVTDVDQSTANELFVVETDKGEMLIPIVDEFILDIDFEKKKIELDLPDGLLEL